jgi:hypothetical protein
MICMVEVPLNSESMMDPCTMSPGYDVEDVLLLRGTLLM